MIGFLKKYKLFIIAAAIAITALAIAFMAGGNPEEVKTTQTAAKSAVSSIESTPDNKTVNEEEATKAENKEKSNQKETEAPTSSTEQSSRTAATEHAQKNEAKKSSSSNSQKSGSSKVQESTKRTVKDKFKTDPIPEGKPEPVEPEEQTIADKKTTVTLSISCASVLNKMDKLDEDKHEIIPSDGWILKPTTAVINEGETVFDVTQRVCKENKVHMEFSFTPIYNSAYIEGIGNLYEFDCGSGSGWMYKVDSWFPIYGCSRYVLKGGEKIEWQYTTNIGNDIGGGYQQWNEE